MAANTMGAVQARSFFSLMFIPEPPANNKNGETRDPRQRRPNFLQVGYRKRIAEKRHVDPGLTKRASSVEDDSTRGGFSRRFPIFNTAGSSALAYRYWRRRRPRSAHPGQEGTS